MKRIEADGISKKFNITKELNQRQGILQRLKIEKPEQKTLWALKEASFQVSDGEWMGVIGENGSGKSTLLRIVSGIMRPTDGNIMTKGKTASIMRLGNGLKEDLTVEENIYLYGSLMGLSRTEIDKRYDDIVSFSGLYEFTKTKFKKLSDGMKLRLAFSIAINVDADVFISDEVLSVGDGEFQRKCLRKMEELKEEGKTIMLASHNLNAINKWCDRALFLDDGKVRSKGDTDEVLRKYKQFLSWKSKNEDLRKFKGDMKDSPIENLEILDGNGKESYVLSRKKGVQGKITAQKNFQNLRVDFLGEIDGEIKGSIYSREIEKQGEKTTGKFSMNSLLLEKGEYDLIFNMDNQPLEKKAKIEILESDERGSIPKTLIFQPEFENTGFLQGSFYAFGDVKNIFSRFKSGESFFVHKRFPGREFIKKNYEQAAKVAGECESNEVEEIGVKEAVDRCVKEESMSTLASKLVNKNDPILSKEKNVEKFRMYREGVVSYVYRQGDKLRAKLELAEDKDEVYICFKCEVDSEVPLKLYGNKAGEGEFMFETESLFLKESPFKVSIKDSKGNVLLDDIKIYVFEAEKNLPEKSVFVEEENPDSSFPDGKFLLLSPLVEETPNRSMSIIQNRRVLEEIEKGYLFEGGEFKKEVENKEKWCLLPEEDRDE